MKYLVTGISGFVGAHIVERLLSQGHSVTGVDINPPAGLPAAVAFRQMSLMDAAALRDLIAEVRPERVIHLASASSVGLSWKEPVACFVNNTNIFLNLIEAIRFSRVTCRVLSVGSSEEYGPVSPEDLPLKESRPSNPMNPYAVARVAQEHLSKVFSKGYGLDIVCTRSFNHLGPGQTDRFVVSSFVRQAVEMSRGTRDAITCGDLDIVRDFIDVRDVIRAYELLLERGIAGEIYNVCSGQGLTLRKLLERTCQRLRIPVKVDVSPALIRPVDNPVIIGDGAKLGGLGFRPAYELDRSLDDMIAWWKGD